MTINGPTTGHLGNATVGPLPATYPTYPTNTYVWPMATDYESRIATLEGEVKALTAMVTALIGPK